MGRLKFIQKMNDIGNQFKIFKLILDFIISKVQQKIDYNRTVIIDDEYEISIIVYSIANNCPFWIVFIKKPKEKLIFGLEDSGGILEYDESALADIHEIIKTLECFLSTKIRKINKFDKNGKLIYTEHKFNIPDFYDKFKTYHKGFFPFKKKKKEIKEYDPWI